MKKLFKYLCSSEFDHYFGLASITWFYGWFAVVILWIVISLIKAY